MSATDKRVTLSCAICFVCNICKSRGWSNMEHSFTLKQLDESTLMQASAEPFSNDNTTVCRCKVSKRYAYMRGVKMHVCAKMLDIVAQLHVMENTEAAELCLNMLKVLDGDCSSSSDASLVCTVQYFMYSLHVLTLLISAT